MLTLVSALTVVLVVMVAAAITVAVHVGAVRAGLAPSVRRRLTFGVAAGIAVLLGVQAALAASGALAKFDAWPPRLMLVVLSAFAAFFFTTRTESFGRVLAAMPPWWPIALQGMRFPIELGLWALAVLGKLPVHLSLDGRNFDVLVGLTAPMIALGVASGRLGRSLAIGWNVIGLCLLANIVWMAVTSIPGPLHLDWPGIPNTIVAEFPYVWLPGFLVPVALFGHVLSLRQLVGASRSVKSRATVAAR